MKKVLVLMLVLGMASLANAGLVIAPATEGVLVGSDLGISAIDGQTADRAVWLVVTGPGTIDMTTGVFADPQFATTAEGRLFNMDIASPDNVDFVAYLAELAGAPVSAVGFADISIPGSTYPVLASSVITGISYAGTADFVVTMFDGDAFANNGSVTITPEPATLAILGLGALLLKRKK